LDTTVFTNGYIVTNISTYGGWANWGRSEQIYTVSCSTIAAPTTFKEIMTLDTGVFFDDVPSYTAASTHNTNTGILATGVKAIQFNFPSQLNGAAGYRELDVLGSPIVDTTPAKAQIVTQPQDVTVPAGLPVALAVVAKGYPLPTYQWFFNGTTKLDGQTNATLTLPSVGAGDAGLYSVAVTNSLGGEVSREAALQVITVTYEHSTQVYAVSAHDLLQTAVGAVDSSSLVVSPESGSYKLPTLTDGIFNTDTNVNRAFAVSGGDLIYYLGSAAQDRGFAISNINVFGGWPNPGRDAQNYVVSYSTASDPSNFINIATVSYNPPGSAPSYTAVQVSDINGALLCNYVRAIKFHFTAQENGAAGYREIDVLGVVLPLPSLVVVKKDVTGVWLVLKGLPNRSYSLLRATDLTGNWANIATVVMDADGTATYLDSNAPQGAAYYRSNGP
jgi:hypothetical protein